MSLFTRIVSRLGKGLEISRLGRSPGHRSTWETMAFGPDHRRIGAAADRALGTGNVMQTVGQGANMAKIPLFAAATHQTATGAASLNRSIGEGRDSVLTNLEGAGLVSSEDADKMRSELPAWTAVRALVSGGKPEEAAQVVSQRLSSGEQLSQDDLRSVSGAATREVLPGVLGDAARQSRAEGGGVVSNARISLASPVATASRLLEIGAARTLPSTEDRASSLASSITPPTIPAISEETESFSTTPPAAPSSATESAEGSPETPGGIPSGVVPAAAAAAGSIASAVSNRGEPTGVTRVRGSDPTRPTQEWIEGFRSRYRGGRS